MLPEVTKSMQSSEDLASSRLNPKLVPLTLVVGGISGQGDVRQGQVGWWQCCWGKEELEVPKG